MTLRRHLLSLAGTLLLAVSPTVLVMAQAALAQDAQAPTTQAPEQIPQRHKKPGQEGQPQAAPGQPETRPAHNKPPQTEAAPADAPPVAPRHQKPAAPDSQPAAPEPTSPAAKPPAHKPVQPVAPGAEAPAPRPAAPSPDGATAPKPNKPAAPQPGGSPLNQLRQKNAQPATPAPQGDWLRKKQGGPAAPGAAKPKLGQQPAPDAAPAPNGAQPAQPAPDQTTPGQALSGRHKPGQGQQPTGGQAPATLPVPGQTAPLPGQPTPDQTTPGQALPGQGGPRQHKPGQRQQGQGQQGQSLPGQPLPSQPLPGQPIGGGQPNNRPWNQQGQPPAMNGGQPQAPFQRGAIDPQAEQRAIGLLADNTPPDRLNDQALRQRLNVYRGALAGNNLSPATEQAMIQRLNGARDALRGRVANQDDAARPSGPGGWDPQLGRPQFRPGAPRQQDVPAILADRRPSNVLNLDQLNRRILVYRDASIDERYSPEDRGAFLQYLQSDRDELRDRMIDDRGQRDNRLRQAEGSGQLRFDLNVDPRGGSPQSVWAAEVGDEQIEQQFAYRPLRPLQQRYPRATFFAQPEMVMEQPFVRQAIPSVELDTIHFGFNESFIREEEIANLDRVGRIIERIVAAHPDEVFAIEGNTDAVGDDVYNLGLSKQRAEAVKQALTQYYLISPNNLVTAGLGERYLKIPTPDPEQENRRVTLRRVTPLLQN